MSQTPIYNTDSLITTRDDRTTRQWYIEKHVGLGETDIRSVEADRIVTSVAEEKAEEKGVSGGNYVHG